MYNIIVNVKQLVNGVNKINSLIKKYMYNTMILANMIWQNILVIEAKQYSLGEKLTASFTLSFAFLDKIKFVANFVPTSKITIKLSSLNPIFQPLQEHDDL